RKAVPAAVSLHDDVVTVFQIDVLLQMLAITHLGVVKQVGLGAAQNLYFLPIREFLKSARVTEGFEYPSGCDQRKRPGPVHLAVNVVFLAPYVGDENGD